MDKGTRAEVTRPLAYQNVEKLLVLCLVQQDGMVAGASVSTPICEKVAQLARAESDIPVDVISLGDPQVIAPNRLTILVHAAISDEGGKQQMVFYMRPYRPSLPEADVLFGSTPRVADPGDADSMTGTISAGLDQILPWRAKPAQPRRIR